MNIALARRRCCQLDLVGHVAALRHAWRNGRRARRHRQSRPRRHHADRRGERFRRHRADRHRPISALPPRPLAGVAANLIFAYLVVDPPRQSARRPVLRLMFFGIGLSALIGRPFVGALITGLPQLRSLGLEPGSVGARLLSYDVLVYLAVPAALATWWLHFPHPLGTRAAHRRRKPGGSVRRRPAPAAVAVSGAHVRRRASAASPERICRSRSPLPGPKA